MNLDTSVVTQNPFAILTVIGAPAILTNASSILGLNTGNRLMRCLDRITHLEEKLRATTPLPADLEESYFKQMELSQKQARQFLRSLKSTYTSLGAFVLACFLALLGGTSAHLGNTGVMEVLAALSLGSGAVGVLSLSHASLELFLASRITVLILKTNMDSLQVHRSTKVIPA